MKNKERIAILETEISRLKVANRNTNERLEAIEGELGINDKCEESEDIGAEIFKIMRNTYDVRNLKASIKPDYIPDWKDAPEDAVCVAMDEDGEWYWYDCVPRESTSIFGLDGATCRAAGKATNADLLPPDYWKSTLMMRPESISDAPDYTHLLPDGYEFCQEQDAEKWIKVENPSKMNPLGHIWQSIIDPPVGMQSEYRPIRPIQYKVTTHEIVTAVPDPYQPDWSQAPEGTVAHAWDRSGTGFWCIMNIEEDYEEGTHWALRYELSHLTLPSDLDWKQSLRVKPN
jgi:hypothetical protein